MSQMDLYRCNRAIIIHRDEMNGYGLTVSGDNPVSVQTIKRGGAADVAGIREGDIIIKVNGTPVQHMNHTEVVDLIRSAGAYVTLTVRPADMSSMPGTIGGNGARSHHLQAHHDRKVTAPLPANHDAQVQMMSSKWNMLQTMHDKVAVDVSRLIEKYKVSGNPKDLGELEKSRNQLMGIQKKMTDIRQPPQNLQLHSPTPFNSTPQSHHSVMFHPTYGRGDHPATNSGPIFPPGQRNRNPLSVQSVSGYPGHRASWEHTDIPPPLPPRSVSQSFSSADHPPTYAVHDPEFHESGTHLFHSNSTNTHSSSGYGNKAHYAPTNTDGFSRSQHFPGGSLHGQGNQQPQTHHRTKSSPDPVSMQKALMAADEAARRADSVSDLSKCNLSPSRTSGAWDLVDSNRTSPPGSPPPPYGKHDPESGVFIDENHAFNNANYSTNDFSPTKSSTGGLPNRTYGIVDIMSMEEDDGLYPRDVGLNSSFSQFNSLPKLMEHNAHLAVFMNYVIDNRCDPSSLLFYLITGMYINEGNIKEMKRWAYEIHSTFTAPGAPLLVPHVDENIAKEIDDGLVHECDKEEMMRRVFRKARNKAKEEINKQLEEFSTKLTAGLGTMFGPPDRELEESLTDKVKEQRIIETYLMPRLEQLYLDFEKSADDRILAIANASATVVQKQFNIRSSSANSVLEKYSAYVSKEKSVLQKKLLNKHKKVQHNGHHFQPLYFYSFMNCNLCCKLLWGVGPQGFQCLDCNMNVHRHCLQEVTDSCVGSDRKKDKGNEKFRKFKPIFRDREQKRRPGSIVSGKTWLQDGFLGSNSFSSSDIDPEYSVRMHHLKSRIQKKKKQNSVRNAGGDGGGGNDNKGSCSVKVENEWQFVNFNPGPLRSRRSIPEEDVTVAPELTLIATKTSPVDREDYYEFPTSTKLQLHKIRRSLTSEESGAGTFGRSNNGECHSGFSNPRNRHSLATATAMPLDLLNADDIPPCVPPPLTPTLNPLLPPRRRLPLPPPGSPLGSLQRPSKNHEKNGSIPENVCVGGGEEAEEYVSPAPPLPPPLPPYRPHIRPHSWTSDIMSAANLSRDLRHDLKPHSKAQPIYKKMSPRAAPLPEPKGVAGRARDDPPPPPRPAKNRHSNPTFGDRSSSGTHNSSSNLKGIDERRPDTVNEENFSLDKFPGGEENAERAPLEPRRVSAAGVTRSESCKERVQKKQPREKRKHSDPNLTSKSSDADLDNQRHLSDANNSGSSSTSSISRSLESPSTSLELVNPSCQSSTSLPGRSSETPDTTTLHSGLTPDTSKNHSWHHHSVQALEGDSDIEIEQDPPDLAKIVPEEALARLDRREKKRQEVLNELCHTERSHVRNLKVLDRLFHRPIRQQQLVNHDVIHALFSNLENMLDLHEKFNNALKNKRKENPIIEEIGSLLLETFDGDNGTYFKKTAAFFCSKQQIGLELLKERRRKDPSFHAFLADAESNPVCRRLQISDMIPMAMQRLTKYPLLFENLCNCTPSDTEEHKQIQRAVELSKEILNSVNHEKKEVENRQRLIDIQRRLDKSSLEKNTDKADANVMGELRNLDFTAHRLIYEGPLRWRMSSKGSKQKSDFHDVQAVLLDDMVALLLKDNDRLVLKMHNVNFTGKTDRVLARPIIKLQNLRLSEFAAEKRAFFLVNTASSNMNMYELWCSSSEERSRWLQHIKEAVDDYKTRQEESRRDVHPPTNIPTIVPEPEDKFKDVNDSGEGQATGPCESNNGEASGSELQGSGLKVVETGDGSFNKDASPAPPDTPSQSNLSPSAGNATQSDQSPKHTAVSPSPNRRKGEFLRVTESSPLIDPSEVVVATRDVQFATPVVSKYEEIKRIDASVGKFLDDKSKLLAKLSPVSPNFIVENSTLTSDYSPEFSSSSTSHAKQLVTACIQEVDQLGRHLAGQKVTSENLTALRDPVAIHKNLSNLLAHLLVEIQRRDEDSEARRQELSRLREQNHGYQERLQARNGSDRHPSPVRLTSPTLSPSHSRPNSFLSLSSSSDQHEEDHGGRISADPKDSGLSTTSGVPDLALKDAEKRESKANGHDLTCSSPNEFSPSCPKISAVLEEQKSMKDNIIITNPNDEDEATKGRGNFLDDAEAEAKLS